MKVLFIHTYYSERGGEDIVFEAESKLFRSRGCEVDSLVFKNTDNKRINFLLSHFNIFSFYSAVRKLRKFKPDVVHLHNWHFAASPSVIWAAKICKVPIVMTLHNYRLLCPSAILFHKGELFFDSLSGKFPWEAIRQKVYRNSMPLTFWLATVLKFHKMLGTWKQVDRFITMSEFAKDIYIKSGLGLEARRIVVKPNFIQDAGYQSNPGKHNFLFVGRLSQEKGLDVIFKAFGLLKFNLVIVGDGPLREQVELMAGNNPEITYLGFQQRDQVQELMKNSSALLFGSKCYEGMPMTILESFACGTPVIAASLGCMPDIVANGYNGLLFNSNDASDLTHKIRQWSEMPCIEKQQYYKNCRSTFSRRFSADINFDKLLAVYEEVL